MLQFENKYGYFTEDGSEYVIKTPRTPKPWINVISNGRYGLTVSQTGGGFSWLDHSEFNRITRWHQDLVRDDWGKYLYFKDEQTGDVWNPGWLPCRVEPDQYRCSHGFGYSRFETEYKDIRSTLTIFVHAELPLEFWDIRFENLGLREREISIYSYFEWCLGSSNDYHREFHKTFLRTEFDPKRNAVLAGKRIWDIALGDRGHWNTEYPYTGFLYASEPIIDFDLDKETFLGQYGSLQNPAGIKAEAMARRQGVFYDGIAATQTRIRLGGQESRRCFYILGLTSDKADLDTVLDRFSDAEQVDVALEAVRRKWTGLLSTSEVETPDKALDLMVNKWLKYQAISGRIWGRSAYYQQSGAYGFRDQLQDSQIFLSIDPKGTEAQIILHAAHQFEDGRVLHWWHPITEQGLDSNSSDDFLWLPFVTLSYLKETGNYEFLNTETAFYRSARKAPLLEHCRRAIGAALGRFSPRGLPLMGSNDWNDGLSAIGIEMKGESIWMAHFLIYILDGFAEMLDELNDKDTAGIYQNRARQLREKLLLMGWDGDWFRRASKDNGQWIGSRMNDEGRIYLNTQTWSVIADSAPLEYQRKAMLMVAEQLMKDNGPLLLYPGYTEPDNYIGYLSRYAAGSRENGGVYTHAATWAIWAFAKLGENRLANEVLRRINPIYNSMDPDRYKGEPYVTPGNIDGPDSPHYGRGGWTWYTGSAAWMQRCALEWILGVRPVKEGLLIDPHVPEEWKQYSIKRLFRGTTYFITVKNESGSYRGVRKMVVDGREVPGDVIPVSDKETCDVGITL